MSESPTVDLSAYVNKLGGACLGTRLESPLPLLSLSFALELLTKGSTSLPNRQTVESLTVESLNC